MICFQLYILKSPTHCRYHNMDNEKAKLYKSQKVNFTLADKNSLIFALVVLL